MITGKGHTVMKTVKIRHGLMAANAVVAVVLLLLA